jgi:hypothetical protein
MVSWATWSTLNAVGSAAAFAASQLPAAVLTLACALECALVAVMAVLQSRPASGEPLDPARAGQLVDRLDVFCLAGAAAGLGTLVLLRSPALATLVTVLTDLVGAVPTVRHSWTRSWEETWSTYALFSVAGALTLLAANPHVFTAVAYPLYLFLFNAGVAALVLTGRLRRQPASRGAQRDGVEH